MLKEIFHDTFENLEITRICTFVWETICKRDRMAKVVFFDTNASNFRRPLQSLLLKYTAENALVN